jgi:hypothetical protein
MDCLCRAPWKGDIVKLTISEPELDPWEDKIKEVVNSTTKPEHEVIIFIT